ncbi:MAG: ribonucleotide-diphosphate reductase subunit beta [Nanoarchaeota archaeon]|nr:ribonucleotide-diphosphate reductase subunit beta [Nanoarchaeota archaeon]
MGATKIFQKDFGELGKISNVDIINRRKVINGEDDGLMQVAPLKHPFADEIFKTMLKNTWVPQEISMGRDVEIWNGNTLTEQEKSVYKRSLAFVSNLDGMQTHNLVSNIVRHITSPEIAIAIVRQAYEEALHVHSYATMVETLGFDPEEIYGLYRKDKELYQKNQQVLNAVNRIADRDFKTGDFLSDQMFLRACVGNMILEGIYFYSAFLNFYILKRNNKMPGSAEMIQFINRDEDLHLKLFIEIVNQIKKEQPELWTEDFKQQVIKDFKDAVDCEWEWGTACIGNGILGLNSSNLRDYLQFVADMRLQSIGLPNIYGSENPFSWIDQMTQGNMTETNFFEGTVREYSIGALQWD